jgi:hypothetical protein
MMILLIAVVCGTGVGSTAIDNLGQIAESLQYPTKFVQISVSMVSFWIYFGRITADTVSEKFLTKYRFPCIYVAAAVYILSSVGYLVIAFPVSYALYIAPVIIGFSHGFELGLHKPIIGDIFGRTNQVILFNLARLGGPLGSYIFNVNVVGRLYDREALNISARADVSELTCIGEYCFKYAFLILTIASILGGVALILLGIRTKEKDVNEDCMCTSKNQDEDRDENYLP